jgi:hypothetical protein
MAGASVIGFFFSALRGSERDVSAMRQSGLGPSAGDREKERV